MDERRYYGLDALRGSMMMLGIILHGAMFYLAAPAPTMPLITDRNNSLVFDAIFHLIHSFRMPTFFVLAGFFAALLVEKRGLWGTYRNRLARVAAPLGAGLVTVLPLAIWLTIAFFFSVRFGTHELVPTKEQAQIFNQEAMARGMPVNQIPLGHLWFLYYLCYFYLLIPLCRLLVQWSRAVEPGLQKLLASPAGFVVFGLYTAATLWPYRGGQLHDGFMFLTPHPPSLVYYGSFFVLGYLAHTYRDVVQALTRHVWRWALLALVLFPAAQYASYLEYYGSGGMGLHALVVTAHGFCTWALIYFFVGLALRYFDRPSPWILYTSQSAYWVFMVHMPVVVVAAWWMLQYDLPALLKFTVIVAFTAAVCFTTYHYWVQRSWISAFLNGKRFNLEWPWRARTGERVAAPV